MKKILLTTLAIFMTTTAIAETCPTIADIQNNNLNGWSAYTNDNGSPLTPEQLANFEKYVGGFYSIRWLAGAPDGESHCYYVNTTKHWTRAYLAKPGLLPDFSSSNWSYIDGEPRCHKSIPGCPFIVGTSKGRK